MDETTRLIQLFVYHTGERIDFITAPAGSGKTRAVRLWLGSQENIGDQVWLDPVTPDTLRDLPRLPDRPTFVVIDNYEPDPLTDETILSLVEETGQALHFVITSRHSPPAGFQRLAEDGVVRLTTREELADGRSSSRLDGGTN